MKQHSTISGVEFHASDTVACRFAEFLFCMAIAVIAIQADDTNRKTEYMRIHSSVDRIGGAFS